MLRTGKVGRSSAAADAACSPHIGDVVFGHIPKTAGTSLRNTLAEAMPGSLMYFDYEDRITDIAGQTLNASDTQTPLLDLIVSARAKMRQRRPMFLSGHFALRKYVSAFHPASFITFLRNPVDRVISEYRHHVAHLHFKGSLSEFSRMPQHANVQARLLFGIDLQSVGFIGLTEYMPEMIERLARYLCLPLKMRRDNVTERTRSEVSDEERRAIAALNNDDVRLYDHVKEHLDEYSNYRARLQRTPLFARGRVNYAGSGTFRGAVITSEAGRLATVEVWLDNNLVHRCFADEYRMPRPGEALPSRRWGFTVNLPKSQLSAAASIRFTVSEANSELTGSPLALRDGEPVLPQAT